MKLAFFFAIYICATWLFYVQWIPNVFPSNGFTMYAPRLCAVFCCIILPYFACASVLCARGLWMRVLLNGSEGLVSCVFKRLLHVLE